MAQKWIQLNASRDEKPTTDEDIHEADAPENLLTLPVEETESAIEHHPAIPTHYYRTKIAPKQTRR